ncbi:UPF0587 protein [Blattella germanica]|nr:UPF0587 protein [Blattella germanica]
MVMKCSSCGEESDKWHDLSLSETVEERTGHSQVHYAAKCKLCILKDTIKDYTKSDSEKFKTIVVFDSRGIDLGGWTAVAEESGHVFPEVDLTEKEWVEYDEKSQQSVGIYNVEHQFVKVK